MRDSEEDVLFPLGVLEVKGSAATSPQHTTTPKSFLPGVAMQRSHSTVFFMLAHKVCHGCPVHRYPPPVV